MRYRIVIEIEVDNATSREMVNAIARRAFDDTITRTTNPVFLSTELIHSLDRDILKDNK